MIGISEHSLPMVHAYARIYYEFEASTLQRLLSEAFISLNKASFQLPYEEVVCTLEVGVADGKDFTFLGEEEARKLRKTLKERRLPRLDFIVYANYRRSLEGARSLWGDLQRVRIVFPEENTAEIQVFHFKGTRRLPLDELLSRIIEQVRLEADRRSLPPPQISVLRGR
ncbi:MAG: hypothetical protein DRO43_01240 [Candidatus Hecatellales archaeon]|nr:MAG: hypothetical protein DRO43_01240 [Candidatus Hecatellales archaeon]